MNSPRIARAAALTMSLTATACGIDVASPTFGTGCDAGRLRPGQTVVGALHEGSCAETRNFYSGYRSPYEGYTVHLLKGHAYAFSMIGVPDAARADRDDLYPMLTVYGETERGQDLPLAFSEGEGEDGSELYFIAQRTGTYRIIAAGYDGVEDGYLGGYQLSMEECPVRAIIDRPGSYSFTLGTSRCIRTGHPFGSGAVPYSFVSIDVDDDEVVGIRVVTDGSASVFEAFGPGIDTYAELYTDSDYSYNYGEDASVTLNPWRAGRVTLAIGPIGPMGDAPTVTLTVTRTAALGAPSMPTGRHRLRPTFPRRAPSGLRIPGGSGVTESGR